MEALLRWQHPDRGLIPPLSFIPLAEQTGLIVPIGRWVLETACRQARDWQRRLGPAAPAQVSVNLSARQFAQPDLVSRVGTTLEATGLDPACLEIEITESVVMDQSEASVERLRALRALGAKLVLDDFGTGYSSLAYLRRLPLDALKIDRSFVSGLGSDAADMPIVQSVISLAHGTGHRRGRGGNRDAGPGSLPASPGLRPWPGLRLCAATARRRAGGEARGRGRFAARAGPGFPAA